MLHHTGQMWKALDAAGSAVASNGKLFIAIYNDTGSQSARWKRIKAAYSRLPSALRVPFTIAVIAPTEVKQALAAVVRLRSARLCSIMDSVRSKARHESLARHRRLGRWVSV